MITYDETQNIYFFAPNFGVEPEPGIVRRYRNQLLDEADILCQKAYDNDENVSEFKAYRQALRDITDQEGFPDVTWPTKPGE